MKVDVKFKVPKFDIDFQKYDKGDVYKKMSDIGDYMIADIIDHFSPKSPSAPYTPPAIDKGYFKRSLNRKSSRRALNKKYVIRISTIATNRFYAVALEKGTRRMQPRPYLEASIDRTINRFRGLRRA
jgi:hypothetical protein